VSDRTVWRIISTEEKKGLPYVPRCSACGDFKEDHFKHWFFTGMYCRDCIQYVLYCDYRRIEDINK